MLKVAIIGTGNIGKIHARCYQNNPQTELVAVCDMARDKADAFAHQFGAKAYYNVEDLLKHEDLQAISVTTAGVENGSHHFEPTMQALEARKAVLCEKPISNDIEQARAMVAKAKAMQVPFGINLNHRFTPAADRLRQLQNDGELGDVLFINMALWFNNPNEPTIWHHIRALHPHSIDVMRYFGGDIKRVQCFMEKAPGRQKMWSTFSLNMQFASGAVGHLTGSMDMSWNHPIERCEVGGSKGRGIIENVYQRLEWMPRDKPEKMVLENGIMGGMSHFDDTFTRRINKFIEQVEAGEPLDASGAEGLAAQEVIEAAIRSHENGTVEEVPQITK
ncbi:MAG: Gfo/Idh/MocA family oxidoreductase [Abitibacteriaceae bacterium]|nr:Gfo/Idh/MocA family oxidoreductase [Abditibacteriaceae bacterium]MBV9867253.1 Gfo/Idh/MocA family oxidoreductase [Abditibacteriaceae bacterium]